MARAKVGAGRPLSYTPPPMPQSLRGPARYKPAVPLFAPSSHTCTRQSLAQSHGPAGFFLAKTFMLNMGEVCEKRVS
jgi:hypothetical protein